MSKRKPPPDHPKLPFDGDLGKAPEPEAYVPPQRPTPTRWQRLVLGLGQRWRKACRSARENWKRVLLYVLGVALGTFALGIVKEWVPSLLPPTVQQVPSAEPPTASKSPAEPVDTWAGKATVRVGED